MVGRGTGQSSVLTRPHSGAKRTNFYPMNKNTDIFFHNDKSRVCLKKPGCGSICYFVNNLPSPTSTYCAVRSVLVIHISVPSFCSPGKTVLWLCIHFSLCVQIFIPSQCNETPSAQHIVHQRFSLSIFHNEFPLPGGLPGFCLTGDPKTAVRYGPAT